MQDVAFAEQAQAQEHLLSIGTNSFQINANVPTKLF